VGGGGGRTGCRKTAVNALLGRAGHSFSVRMGGGGVREGCRGILDEHKKKDHWCEQPLPGQAFGDWKSEGRSPTEKKKTTTRWDLLEKNLGPSKTKDVERG